MTSPEGNSSFCFPVSLIQIQAKFTVAGKKSRMQSTVSIAAIQKQSNFQETGDIHLTKCRMLTRVEMNNHITKSGNTIGNIDHHNNPTGLIRARRFLDVFSLKRLNALY